MFQLAEELKNENLVITTLKNDRLSGVENKNETMFGTGVAFDILNILQAKFQFNYTVIVPKVNVWGSEKSGILDMLRNGQANLSVAFLPVLTEYSNDISYSPSLDTGEWVVLMKRPKESATGSGLLAPFTLPVWLLILLSLVVVGPVIYLIIYIQAKLCKDDHNNIFPLPACIWFVYGALLKQGTTLNPMTDSSRILFSTWWIFITILTAFYTANLTAFLTLSKFTLPINQPEDIGAKKSKWVTTRGNALEDSIKTNDSTLSPVGRMLGYPYGYLDRPDRDILRQYVDKQNMMFIREKPVVEYVMYDDYKEKTRNQIEEAKRCTYVITKFSVVSFSRAFAYSKNFKYKQVFDSTIQNLVESGIIKYKLREELPDTAICPLNLGNKERQLRNSDLLMTYEIVGGGFIIASVIFIIELIIRRSKNPNIKITKSLIKELKLKKPQKHTFHVNINNNYEKLGQLPFTSKFVTPPPSYNTLFNPPSNNDHIKKKNINGREYWVYDSSGGEKKMVPLRTPSALLFQFTN
ncbi:glutamate receptor ionotropic, delta-1, partial [Asbolus verrucosus]